MSLFDFLFQFLDVEDEVGDFLLGFVDNVGDFVGEFVGNVFGGWISNVEGFFVGFGDGCEVEKVFFWFGVYFELLI